MDDLLGVALRVTITYLYAQAAIRLTGKRTLGQLGLPDAAAAFMVGDMFDNIFWGKVEISRGLGAVGVVIALHFLVVYGCYRWRSVSRVVEGSATTVVRAGHPVAEGMRHEHMARAELDFLLREKGVDRIEEIEEARDEHHDHVSVIKKREYRPAQKQDAAKLEAALQ